MFGDHQVESADCIADVCWVVEFPFWQEHDDRRQVVSEGSIELHDVVCQKREVADKRVVQVIRNTALFGASENHLDVEKRGETVEDKQRVWWLSIGCEHARDAVYAGVMCRINECLAEVEVKVVIHTSFEQQIVDLSELKDASFEICLP